MPYLVIKNFPAFISFAKSVFNAEEMMSYSNENGEIIHAEIKIGDSTIMAGESNDKFGVQTAGLYITVNSADRYLDLALKLCMNNLYHTLSYRTTLLFFSVPGVQYTR
jgi:PhnB protein